VLPFWAVNQSYEYIRRDSYKQLCSTFLRSKGIGGTEMVGEQTVLDLMVEFTDVTSQELNRVITNMLLDYVTTAVKQIDVLDWVKETDKPLRKP
jgi:hypothetical protein